MVPILQGIATVKNAHHLEILLWSLQFSPYTPHMSLWISLRLCTLAPWARWRKWKSCDVGERKKSWRMSCDVGEATESLENELCYDYNYELCSFSKFSVTSPTSQLILILQSFRHFTYVTAHSPTLPLLHLCHRSFSNPSLASPTSQDLHLRHLASSPWSL